MEQNDLQIGSWNGLTLVRELAGSSRGSHRHQFHMLRLQTRGATITEWRSLGDAGTTVLRPGNLAFFTASARHGTCNSRPHRSEEPNEQIVALISETMLQQAIEIASVTPECVRLEDKRIFRDRPLEHMVWALRDVGMQKSSTRRLLGETLSNAIALHLIGNHSSGSVAKDHKGGIPGPRLRHVLDYVEEHLEGDLSLSSLATEATMTVFHFSRAFRQSTGQSPYQYVLQRRIEWAKKLLRKSDLTVGEISFQTGFIQQTHFARLFQRKTGLTPTAFRRQFFLLAQTHHSISSGGRRAVSADRKFCQTLSTDL
jgi:AraC family transcriptional regulator